MADFDLIIIGAGPAGMTAASTASNGGARVLLLDEQPQPGGQIYRNVAEGSRPYLGKDYAAGLALVKELSKPNIECVFGASVWRMEPGAKVIWSKNGKSEISIAPQVLLAVGAQERPTPFPGWTLPGVMSIGAAQILMKSSGLLPRDAILAGSGPLLYLVAAQMIDGGIAPKALVETQSKSDMIRASRHLPRALLDTKTFRKGLGLIHKIKRAGVERFTNASNFIARQDKAGGVRFTFQSNGAENELRTSLLLTHQGVVPSTHISRASGVKHRWNAIQQSYYPVTDKWGATNIPGIHIAGDGAGIGGADAAIEAGKIAALNILNQLGRLSEAKRDKDSTKPRRNQRRRLGIRPFLDAAYAPSADLMKPPNETILCRCEEISAADVRNAVQDGACGMKQVKTATRAGMGSCQGRMCDLNIRGIVSACGVDVSAPRARTPIKPVTLGEMAALEPISEV